MLLLVVVMSSAAALLAPEHLLEEVELRRHCAQQGKEERKEELVTHLVLSRADSSRKYTRKVQRILKGFYEGENKLFVFELSECSYAHSRPNPLRQRPSCPNSRPADPCSCVIAINNQDD